LRAIFNDAKIAGIIKENQYPFGKGKYEIPNFVLDLQYNTENNMNKFLQLSEND
jgi:hypothetical protein